MENNRKSFTELLNYYAKVFNNYANGKAAIDARKAQIANRLRYLRMEHQLTQAQISQLAKIDKQTYSGYENARSNTPVEALVRLAIVYDVSLDYICMRTDNKKGCYFQETAKTDDKQLADILARLEKLEKKEK